MNRILAFCIPVALIATMGAATPAPKPTPDPVTRAAQIGFEIGQITLQEHALVARYKQLDKQLKADQKALAALTKARAKDKR